MSTDLHSRCISKTSASPRTSLWWRTVEKSWTTLTLSLTNLFSMPARRNPSQWPCYFWTSICQSWMAWRHLKLSKISLNRSIKSSLTKTKSNSSTEKQRHWFTGQRFAICRNSTKRRYNSSSLKKKQPIVTLRNQFHSRNLSLYSDFSAYIDKIR